MKKKTKVLIVIGIICVIGVVIGTSYALWVKIYSQQDTNIVNSSCFEIVFTEDRSSSIQLDNAFPIRDVDGKKLKPYTFTIKNNCDNYAKYQLNLETTKNTSMSDSYIKVMVNEKNPILLTNNPTINPTISNGRSGYLLEEGLLQAKESKNFSIRVWIDENVGPENKDAMNQTFESKITVTTSHYVPTLLADAMLINENQSSSVEEAKVKIKNKTPDLTKDAPIVENGKESPESDKGLYQAMDDDGETYYYRGNVNNNYVKFADVYWRIMRLNGDGSVRLLYAGTTPNATGANLSIGSSVFNSNYRDPAYVGYMYGKNLGVSYEDTVKNEESSTIKTKLDAWYEDNIIAKGLEDRVADSIFCNDREIYSGDGFSNETGYQVSYRMEPIYFCHQVNDRFTVSEEKGNGALTYPIGLVTWDDLDYAGHRGNCNYLYDNGHYYGNYVFSDYDYWTMSPTYYVASMSEYYGAEVLQFIVCSPPDDEVHEENGVRPVINLKADIQISGGSGISSDPFVVI